MNCALDLLYSGLLIYISCPQFEVREQRLRFADTGTSSSYSHKEVYIGVKSVELLPSSAQGIQHLLIAKFKNAGHC